MFAELCRAIQSYMEAYEADVGEAPHAIRLCSKHYTELLDCCRHNGVWTDADWLRYKESKPAVQLLGKLVLVESVNAIVVCYVCTQYKRVC